MLNNTFFELGINLEKYFELFYKEFDAKIQAQAYYDLLNNKQIELLD
ncbi:MAG: hypothetical protein N3D10_04030 [Candidatus Micrarchaeota archaeon]|nr:hypothetical protein [Candidatus Micrarchaeota archaeon]